MGDDHLDRRRFLRGTAALGAAATAVALAGCGGPEEGGGDGDGDGGTYRYEGVDPQAGISAGGSSAG